MPYEYEIFGHSDKTLSRRDTKDWLNKVGGKNWQLVHFNEEIDGLIIIMREIEINPKLRKIQTKEDEENGNRSSETTKEIPG